MILKPCVICGDTSQRAACHKCRKRAQRLGLGICTYSYHHGNRMCRMERGRSNCRPCRLEQLRRSRQARCTPDPTKLFVLRWLTQRTAF